MQRFISSADASALTDFVLELPVHSAFVLLKSFILGGLVCFGFFFLVTCHNEGSNLCFTEESKKEAAEGTTRAASGHAVVGK